LPSAPGAGGDLDAEFDHINHGISIVKGETDGAISGLNRVVAEVACWGLEALAEREVGLKRSTCG